MALFGLSVGEQFGLPQVMHGDDTVPCCWCGRMNEPGVLVKVPRNLSAPIVYGLCDERCLKAFIIDAVTLVAFRDKSLKGVFHGKVSDRYSVLQLDNVRALIAECLASPKKPDRAVTFRPGAPWVQQAGQIPGQNAQRARLAEQYSRPFFFKGKDNFENKGESKGQAASPTVPFKGQVAKGKGEGNVKGQVAKGKGEGNVKGKVKGKGEGQAPYPHIFDKGERKGKGQEKGKTKNKNFEGEGRSPTW
jgi:hypothetical protein